MNNLILAIVDDMFFASKIRATAEALGVKIGFGRPSENLAEKARTQKPDLIIIDLNNEKVDASDLAKELKGDPELSAIRILGFFSHVDVELQKAAVEAGFDQVVPRSVFARDLATILQG